MPLTLNADLLTALRRAPKQVVVSASISTSSSSTIFTAITGAKRIEDLPNIISGITPRKARWDVDAMRHTVGRVTVEFLEAAWLRRIVNDFVIRGGKLELKLGAVGIATADWHSFFVGEIIDPVASENGHKLHAADARSLLQDELITGDWTGFNLLRVIEDILVKARVDTSLYDATSIDPQTAANASIGQYTVARTGRAGGTFTPPWATREVVAPVPAGQLMDEATRLLLRTWVPDNRGRYTLRAIDRTRAVDKHFTRGEVLEIQQLSTYDPLVNRSSVLFPFSLDTPERGQPGALHGLDEAGGGAYTTIRVSRDNASAQNAIRWPGAAQGRIVPEQFTAGWLSGVQVDPTDVGLPMAITNDGDGTYTLGVTGLAAKYGFCGTHRPVGLRTFGSVPGGFATLSAAAGRFAYLMLVGRQSAADPWGHEIVRADGVTFDWAAAGTPSFIDPSGEIWPPRIFYSVDQRTLSGSTITFADSASPRMWADITIPYLLTKERVDWLSDGAPRLRLRVHIDQAERDYADAISVDDDIFSGTQMDGLNSDDVFVVTDIEIDATGASPGVWLEAIWVRTTAVVIPTTTVQVPVVTLGGIIDAAAGENDATGTFRPFLPECSDFGFTELGGLSIAINPGQMAHGSSGLRSRRVGRTTFTLAANRDTYFYFGPDGTFLRKELANGAAAPARPDTYASLWKFATNASQITAKVDLRECSPLNLANGGYYFDDAGAIYFDDGSEPYWP